MQFDPNWDCDEAPQRFIYYEEDNAATTNIGTSYTTKREVKIGTEGIASATIGAGTAINYSTAIQADDDIIWGQTYERDEYFKGNNSSTGCGTTDGWARYACYEGFFTLPEKYTD